MKKGYKNVKTFSDISSRSSGNFYYYPEFNAYNHNLKFSNELHHNLTRNIAWESVFRVRFSHGFNMTESFGNIQIKQKTTDLVLAPTMDTDRVFIYEFEKLPEDNTAANAHRMSRISKRYLFIQSALLYSSSNGQRRIRCHNVAVPLCQSINDAYEFLDISSTTHLLLRKALSRFDRVPNIEQSKMVIESAVMNMARANQRHTVTAKGTTFEFSENMQYFFMYVLGALKSQIINLPVVMNPIDTIDKIVYQRYLAMMMTPDEMLQLFSPQIINIADPNLNDQEFPALEVLERNSLNQESIYLLFNSYAIYMYVGRQCDPHFYQ